MKQVGGGYIMLKIGQIPVEMRKKECEANLVIVNHNKVCYSGSFIAKIAAGCIHNGLRLPGYNLNVIFTIHFVGLITMNPYKPILLCVLFSSMVSCIPEHKICQPYLIDPVLIGFSTTEIDTLILRRYKENDNYQHLIDTLLIVNAATNNGLGAGIYTTQHDTTIVDINISSPYSPIVSGYDWQLYIPAKNKTITFSNIVTAQNGGGNGCSQPIVSFMQDGQLIDAPTFFGTDKFYTSGYRAYIHP